jgi:hypothetical protein
MAKEESAAIAENRGERHERFGRVKVAVVAQQGVAAEAVPRVSSGYW